MDIIRKTVTVTSSQDKWIKRQISKGEYTNESEYFRDLIRRDQAEHNERELIRAALIEGEQSGEAIPFSLPEFLARMKQKYADIPDVQTDATSP